MIIYIYPPRDGQARLGVRGIQKKRRWMGTLHKAAGTPNSAI